MSGAARITSRLPSSILSLAPAAKASHQEARKATLLASIVLLVMTSRIYPDLHSTNPPDYRPGAILVISERTLIRRFQASDASNLVTAANFPTLVGSPRDLFPYPYTHADAEDFLSEQVGDVLSRLPLHSALIHRGCSPYNTSGWDQLVGGIVVTPQENQYYRTWELSFWLSPLAFDLGILFEALEAYCRWMFVTWPGLNRLEARVFADNPQVIKLWTDLGFQAEGKRREVADYNGQVMDEYIYSMLRSDTVKITA